MPKIYAKKSFVLKSKKPKKETISFLLSYSKSLTMLKIDSTYFEIIAN